MIRDIALAEKDMEELYKHSCSYINRIKDRWRRRIFFSSAADIRLGHIYGHILGIYQSDITKRPIALNMIHDLHRALNHLCHIEDDAVFEQERKLNDGVSSTDKIKAPYSKISLHDDGTFHSFSFVSFAPCNPFKLKTEFQAVKEEEKSKLLNSSLSFSDFLHRKKIVTHVFGHTDWESELTESRYVLNEAYHVYYVENYHGGLIYHGQGGGENFSVSLSNDSLWVAHT